MASIVSGPATGAFVEAPTAPPYTPAAPGGWGIALTAAVVLAWVLRRVAAGMPKLPDEERGLRPW